MTKEIWAATIISIIQIIAMLLATKWQITSTKALMTPEQNQVIPKTSLLARISKYLVKSNLHIIIPTMIYMYAVIMTFMKQGLNAFTSLSLILLIVYGMFMLIFYSLDIMSVSRK